MTNRKAAPDEGQPRHAHEARADAQVYNLGPMEPGVSTVLISVLESLGWDDTRRAETRDLAEGERVARVAAVDRGVWHLAGLIDNPEHLVTARRKGRGHDVLETPTVGDWVVVRELDTGLWVERVLSRRSCFARKAAGRRSAGQLLAANIDRVLLVTSVGDDLNPRRIERYLAAIAASGAAAAIVVNKNDRPHDREELHGALLSVAQAVPVVFTCAHPPKTGEPDGLAELMDLLPARGTVAFVGSSGVGKSSLVNRLLEREAFATTPVRVSDDHGRHTTSRRNLVVAPNGTVLIDTPGLRELALWDADDGLDEAFSDLTALAARCRFADCAHDEEPGCAVREAVERGDVSAERLGSFQQLKGELADTADQAREQQRRGKQAQRSLKNRKRLHGKLGLKDG